MATSQVEWDNALMAPLKNPRHEAFVHNYLKCGDATEAFELSGYVRDSANAHRLLNRPKDTHEISLAMADDALKYKIEPYHDFREEDRQHVAQIYLRRLEECFAEVDAYIEEIRARPLKRVTHLPKALPSPFNGKSDSQSTPD